MPIYCYKCNNCEKIFEKFEKSGSMDKIICSDCGSEALRIFSPVGIVFKGKGFYSTDYGSGMKMASEKTPQKETAKEAGKEIKDSQTAKKEQEGKSSEK
ncbi:MAG: zinc ribbon domain-containing protein [Actinobacteria bacterium]|nr:zinc ribbon domain-containing protein [Cyanobacteriota bacterium]MCL6087636.1 zinc ribbon domain-containing protein [Actinomycetota bacterium]